MKAFLSRNVTLFTLLSAGVGFLFFFYHANLLAPSKYLFSDEGDGVKAMYVFMYHAVHDTDPHQTSSINYPFGETFIYTDGQILFANLFRFLHSISPWFSENAIGFLNLLMIGGYIICFIALYKIFIRLSVSPARSALFAFLIGLLSPQLFRMLGHPTLSYVFIFPLLILFTIGFVQEQSLKSKIRFSIQTIVLITLSAFVHPYYALIAGLFLAGFLVFSYLFSSPKRIHPLVTLLQLLQMIIPLLVSRWYQTCVDIHSGRPLEPYGLLSYQANPSTIFLPYLPPFHDYVQKLVGAFHQEWEGWAYIGLASVLILIAGIVSLCYRLMNRKMTSVDADPAMRIALALLLTGILAMIYACAWPFQLAGLKVLQAFPFLWQFRSLGRFAWICYYTFTIFSAVLLYRWELSLEAEGKKRLPTLLIITYSVLMFTEAWYYHRDVAPRLSRGINQFNKSYVTGPIAAMAAKAKASGCQAILPLPYYHIGSEGSTRVAPDLTYRNSMYVAYHSGLPLVASSAARGSQTESRLQFQSLAPAWYPKEITEEYTDKRPLLVFYAGDALLPDEQDLLKKSRPLFSAGGYQLLMLEPDSLLKFNNEELLSRKSGCTRPVFVDGTSVFTSGDSSEVYFKGYDRLKSTLRRSGTGAVEGTKRDYTRLFDSDRDSFKLMKDTLYVVSCWYYNRGEAVNANTLFVEEVIDESGKTEQLTAKDVSIFSEIDGTWTRLEVTFRPKGDKPFVRVYLHSGDPNDKTIYVDELLLAKAGVHSYWEKDGRTYVDNHPLYLSNPLK